MNPTDMNLTETAGDRDAGAVYALVLAAGAGSRFGGDKLLADLNGRPLIAHVAAAVAEAMAAGVLAGGVAVLRPADTLLGWHLDTAGLKLLLNPDADSGMASSLRRGLAALARETSPAASAALILLGDEPLIRSEVIRRVVERWRQTGLTVRPRYRERPDEPGHPVALDRSLWPLAESLEGDRGLGDLLRSRPEAVTLCEVAGANPDVDTPGDLRQLSDDNSDHR